MVLSIKEGVLFTNVSANQTAVYRVINVPPSMTIKNNKRKLYNFTPFVADLPFAKTIKGRERLNGTIFSLIISSNTKLNNMLIICSLLCTV